MSVRWAVLLSSAGVLLGSAAVSAQDQVTLSAIQLDGVVPAYQFDPSRYQLRVAVEGVLVTNPDRVRDALLTDASEAMEAQRMPAEEPEVRCTPARRALLALAGRSESPGELTSPQGAALTTSSAPRRQSANTQASRLAAASPDPAITGGAASPAQTGSVSTGSSQPTAVRNAGSSGRQVGANSSRPAATVNLGSSARQAVSGSTGSSQPTAVRNAGSSGRQVGANSSRPAATVNLGSSARQAVSGSNRPPAITSAGAAGKRAPAAAVASRAPKIEVPIRTVRSDNASRSSGDGAVRAASGANAADIVAGVRSQVSRALSAVPGGGFRLR